MKRSFFTALFALVLLICAAAFFLRQQLTTPISLQPGMVKYPNYFEIKSGMPVARLAALLKQKKYISHKMPFILYLRLTGHDRSIKSGTYLLPDRASALQLIRKFISGETAVRRITIPEGSVSWEIYSILRRFYILDSLVFDSLIHNKRFIKTCSLQAPTLEGYLFPDTYHLPFNLSERQILKILTTQCRKVLQSIGLEKYPLFHELGLHGVMTLASIVEGEAAVASEQRKISGVFQNRLKRGMPLGADPTVRFALKKLTGPLYHSDLKNPSPYNTRIYPGLPPGPINNPGRNAILAALKPEDTVFLYFVAKDNGSREHFFAKSLRQHIQNKGRRRENRIKRTGVP